MANLFRAAVDGGSRGNPGPAAWGVAVFGEDGSVVESHTGTLGRATNNVAEYHALIAALELARERGAERVEIRMDSELIVKQVRGEYRVKHPDLKPLFARVMRALEGFDSYDVSHVRREKNRDADRLVNLALDRSAG